MWFRRRRQKKRRRAKQPAAFLEHYASHKEFARTMVHEKLAYWNTHYNFSYKRVSIKNQRSCWGSCSEHGNLNFNYKLILLPEHLMDYVIVHELCHIAELNHSPEFWQHVGVALPDYKIHKAHLQKMTHVPLCGFPSSVLQQRAVSQTVTAVATVHM